MNTCKLLIAVSLITSSEAPPDFGSLNQVNFALMSAKTTGLLASPLAQGPLLTSAALGCENVNEVFPFVAPSLRTLAIKLEILDRRETSYVLSDPDNFSCDLDLLQRRFQELADAPLLSECERFPSRTMINELLSFNRSFRQDLVTRLALDHLHSEQIKQAIEETDQLYHIWNTLRDARCGYYYISVRRQALKNLREMMTPAAFYRGELPPHVPIWRIARNR